LTVEEETGAKKDLKKQKEEEKGLKLKPKALICNTSSEIKEQTGVT